MRDIDVRNAVRTSLRAAHEGDPNTRIVEEMGLWSGTVRIDVAVINGELAGFELKSDKDTLERLPLQADIYSRVFDKMTLVVGARHAQKAERLVPEWWSIIQANQVGSSIALTQSRQGSANPSPDAYLVAQLLWKEEALSVLEEHGLVRGWRGRRVRQIHERLAAELNIDDLRSHVRTTLKRRGSWLGQDRVHQLDMAIDA